jgi:Fe-S cluster biogenesis protein NfuA
MQTPPPTLPGSGKKSVIKVLRTRETPNPNALQYVLNATILDKGSRSYNTKADCKGDKLGEELFALPGARSVFVMDNFVTVTKDEGVNWQPFRDLAWKIIDRLATYYEPEAAAKTEVVVEDFKSLSHEDKLKAIETVLNRSIRSNLARDGGGVELKGLEENKILIRYQGACGSCPTSTSGTLKYIEGLMKQQLHPDLTVVPA